MKDVKKLIPHREPFLFVDSIEKADDDEIIGSKKFTEEDFFFKGHFPGYPVVPGVILVEALAQCGGAGVKSTGTVDGDALFFLATISKAKFKRQVRPGDEVKLIVSNLRVSDKMLKQGGKAFVGDELAAEAEWLCIVGSEP